MSKHRLWHQVAKITQKTQVEEFKAYAEKAGPDSLFAVPSTQMKIQLQIVGNAMTSEVDAVPLTTIIASRILNSCFK